jgi:hypothetical protein
MSIPSPLEGPEKRLPMRRLLFGFLLTSVLAASAAGQDRKALRQPLKPTAGVERKDVGPTVPPAAVEKQIARLTDQVHWHTSLDEAKALARQENKPIFWLHALGDLDGIC